VVKVNIVIFSGGRGCTNIIKSLLKQTDSNLSIVVNAYDNGKSTGRIRRFIPGLLGPSDIRKNVSTIMEFYGDFQISSFLEFRLQKKPTDHSLINFIEASQPINFALLTVKQYKFITIAIENFENYQKFVGDEFDTLDCPIGNILIAGLFLQENKDFNLAIDFYQKIFLPINSRAKIINVTDGENFYLIARSNSGKIFVDEADIVENKGAESIREISLVRDPQQNINEKSFINPTRPKINQIVAEELSEMDILIYGPGTQSSSLLPSYLTLEVMEKIAKNLVAKKIFISNLIPDYDDPVSNVASRLETFFSLVDRLEPGHPQSSFISNVFTEIDQDMLPQMLFKEKFPGIAFQTDSWLTESNKHLGAAIVRQISYCCGGSLKFKPGFVSVILNESRLLPNFDEYLRLLENIASDVRLDVELIIVSKFREEPNNLLISNTQISKAYINKSIQFSSSISNALLTARGDLIAYLESSDLYSVSDVSRGIALLITGKSRLAIGSRNLKLLDLKKQVQGAYPKRPIRGFVAYWGSLALSISFLLRYRRFITDPLTGVKIFRKEGLSSVHLEKIGLDININLLKYFIKHDCSIEQFDIDFFYTKLTKINQHGFQQGLKSIARIWFD